MSYQLEREIGDRIERYRREAEIRRAVRSPAVRQLAAGALRRWADRLDGGIGTSGWPGARQQPPFALRERNG